MRTNKYIEGFNERIDEACIKSGLTKKEIARRAGFDRKTLSRMSQDNMMNSGALARFCNVTHSDANWLLGIKEG